MEVNTTSKNPVSSLRDRLLETALELFATRGFHAISLRDLASYLGLHAGSLYHHVESKQSLLYELIESALSDLLVRTERRMRDASTPSERVYRFVQAFVAFRLSEKHKLVLVTREFVNLNEEHQYQAGQLKKAYSALISTSIADKYQEEGKLDDEVHLITSAIIGMLYGQPEWECIEVTEQQLTQALTHFVTGIIGGGKTITH